METLLSEKVRKILSQPNGLKVLEDLLNPTRNTLTLVEFNKQLNELPPALQYYLLDLMKFDANDADIRKEDWTKFCNLLLDFVNS